MQIWRLVAHHEQSEKALEQMKKLGRIAIGWSNIGDLTILKPQSGTDISSKLKDISPDSRGMMAGPSLWNLYSEVEIGDQIIVTAKKRRACVFEVTGEYFFNNEHTILGYSHQRAAALTDIDPQKLWLATGSSFARGENVRWTLAKCSASKETEKIVYLEGRRFSVISTVTERDRVARDECLRIYGYSCQVCRMNFERTYGEIGKGYIHVHHRIDLSHRSGVHSIDPRTDLIPLCPNCHAMVHKDKPAMSIEKLKDIYKSKNV